MSLIFLFISKSKPKTFIYSDKKTEIMVIKRRKWTIKNQFRQRVNFPYAPDYVERRRSDIHEKRLNTYWP